MYGDIGHAWQTYNARDDDTMPVSSFVENTLAISYLLWHKDKNKIHIKFHISAECTKYHFTVFVDDKFKYILRNKFRYISPLSLVNYIYHNTITLLVGHLIDCVNEWVGAMQAEAERQKNEWAKKKRRIVESISWENKKSSNHLSKEIFPHISSVFWGVSGEQRIIELLVSE